MWMLSWRSVESSSMGLDDTRAMDEGQIRTQDAAIVRRMSESAVQRLTARVSEVAGAEVELERPKDPSHGDFATNVAMRSAKAIGRPPRELAQELADKVATLDEIESAEVAGPGFLNLRLADAFFLDALGEVGEDYGGGWAERARARAGRDGLGEPDRPDRRLALRGTAPTATASRGCSRSAGMRSRASTTTTTPARRWTASARRSTRCGAASRCRRTATTATTSSRARRGGRRPGAEDARVDRARRWSGSASTSTAGRCRASSSSGCRSSCRGSTPTRRTARSGRARPRTATSRTGCSIRSADKGGTPTYRAADVVYLVDKLERGFDKRDLRPRRRPPCDGAAGTPRSRACSATTPIASRGAALPVRASDRAAARRRRRRSARATSCSSTS